MGSLLKLIGRAYCNKCTFWQVLLSFIAGVLKLTEQVIIHCLWYIYYKVRRCPKAMLFVKNSRIKLLAYANFWCAANVEYIFKLSEEVLLENCHVFLQVVRNCWFHDEIFSQVLTTLHGQYFGNLRFLYFKHFGCISMCFKCETVL